MQISFWISTRSDTVDERLFQCLKEAGLDFVFLGIESWDNSTLERMNKNLSVRQNSIACSILSKLNIDFRVGFIMFDPFCRMEDVVTNINAIKNYLAMGYRLYSADSLYRKTRAFIGTELFETLNKNNLLFKISSYHYDYKFEIQETEDFYSNLNIWIAKTKETQRLINRINLLILHGSLPKRIQIIASKFVKRWLIFQISIFENILDHWMASKCIYSNAKYIHSLITKYRYSLFCFYKVALIYLFCSRFYLISLKDQQYKNKKNLGMQKNKVK
jgi:radical SAM superfamily enzyme YgiQ (UPF0313 family)